MLAHEGISACVLSRVGQRSPAPATSAGRVFLAHLPPDQSDAVLAEDLQRYTPHTVINLVVLLLYYPLPNATEG